MQTQPAIAEGIHVSAIARAVGGNAVTIRYVVVLMPLYMLDSAIQRCSRQIDG